MLQEGIHHRIQVVEIVILIYINANTGQYCTFYFGSVIQSYKHCSQDFSVRVRCSHDSLEEEKGELDSLTKVYCRELREIDA
jgi:hypothetical protein